MIASALLLSACEGTGFEDPDGGLGPDLRVPEFTEAEWDQLRALAPDTLPPSPPDVSNRWADDEAAAAFGRTLFFEPGFSGALLDEDNNGNVNSLGNRGEYGRVACSGCHMERSAFTDTRSEFQQISLGTGWTSRRTPPLLDVAQAPLVGWGGRHSTLHSQIFVPLENPLEMNSSRLYVAHRIRDLYRDEYEAIFGADALEPLADETRFPRLDGARTGCQLTRPVAQPRALPPDPIYECHGMPGDGAEHDGMQAEDQDIVARIVTNAGKAISAFERTLHCPPGRFDAFVHGDPAALSPAEQRGLALFIGEGRCTDCHSGPYFSDQRFHNLGLAEVLVREGILNANDRGAAVDIALAIADPLGITSPYSDGDDGRLPDELGEELEGAFKTPSLRCLTARPHYMHSGVLETLDSVVAFHVRGGDESGYPGVGVLEPIDLGEADQRDLVAFLRTL